jgi:hypothetical protein
MIKKYWLPEKGNCWAANSCSTAWGSKVLGGCDLEGFRVELQQQKETKNCIKLAQAVNTFILKCY